ncbi:hypothetical protein STSP2_00074 [Anaerohalosphaera lusitana]|uniref:Uncharacterized protein n=1 Tax=Anaerohalosphaera lusitana TaxID=1936003 RepID=A0A1U9NHF3_9BACT|nr:hypothetical protein [Anaerohalosphaera lusitana]AQT66936.1 hypothetical protein STSP2_00074 [Anaerohalosphaera lusitana]
MPDRDINIGRVDSLHHVAGKKNLHNEVENKEHKRKREQKKREQRRRAMQQQLDELVEKELESLSEQTDDDGEGHIDFHA